jgi:hypothetical protein
MSSLIILLLPVFSHIFPSSPSPFAAHILKFSIVWNQYSCKKNFSIEGRTVAISVATVV